MKTASQLLREAEDLKSRLTAFSILVNNNEAWTIQQQLQLVSGQLLVYWIEAALDRGVEIDLWNLGFRNTISQLQAQARDKRRGGVSEDRDILGWFLNSASGFYLQLFNQICYEYGLDLPFRRKDSIYGAIDLNSPTITPSKTSSQKNALYLCQYCLVHLGDLARYRQQAKQAETYYRHAVLVAPTSGHPYNQLALLEAGRGNRLAAVALYVRAMCVPCPFPVTPANLSQTLSKLLASSGHDKGGSTRVTGDEYSNLFLQCHARLYLHSDAKTARQALPTIASALSTLVATNAFTRTSLIQMVVVNLFALSYFSGDVKIKTGEDVGSKKDEEKPEKPKECEGCLEVVEEVTVAMLAALLLPVHTIRDSDQLITYPGLPAIRLMFEWVRCKNSMLSSEAMKKKQQIWPGLCTLVNNLQHHLGSFNNDKYSEVPLPEDWDLQGFEPLQKMLNKFKYREGLCKPSPEEYNCIRASRLTDVAKWFTEQLIDGNHVIKVREGNEDSNCLTFEPMHHSSPPVDEVRALEQLSLQPTVEEKFSNRRGKVGILKPQGSLERARETREQQESTESIEKAPRTPCEETTKELGGSGSGGGQSVRVAPGHSTNTTSAQLGGGGRHHGASGGQGMGTVEGQPRQTRTRTNVALQAIMKRNSAMQEAKQVTFKTPSPAISPNPSEASSDSHRSQLSTPPLMPATTQRDVMSSSPMPYQHQVYHMAPHTQGQGYRQNQADNTLTPQQQQQQQFGGQTAWGGVNNPSQQQNINLSMHQQKQPMGSQNFSAQRTSNVCSPQNVLQQAQSSVPSPADLLTAGIFNRPFQEGFQQVGGHMQPRPGLDMHPRPGVDMPPRPGIDMPPRPGGLPPRPAVDMPPRPGVSMPLRPGVDMPPRPSMNMPPPRPSMDMPPRPGVDMPLRPEMPPRPGMNMPPRPGLDMSTRMREPVPRMLDVMSMTRAPPPSFGQMDGLPNPLRLRLPGSEGSGLENPQMMQVPYRSPQSPHDVISSPSQTNANQMFPPNAVSQYGRMDGGCTNVSAMPASGLRMFGESNVEPRSPGYSQPMSWSTNQGESKNYPLSHPTTLAGLLQQHASVDMRLNLSLDNSSEQHNSGIPGLSGGPSTHNPGMSPCSPPGVDHHGNIHLGMLNRLSTQPTGPRPQAHLSPLHSFMNEGSEGDGSSGNTYSLFSPMSGSGLGSGPNRTVPHPLYPATSQPTGQQSLWSGPGPSPLERLLEQKKYSSVPK